MSTLGYKNDEVFNKSDIAIAQLVEAINLFVRESFLCAITLSGAAEEIFAGLLRARGKSPAIKASISRIIEIREKLGVVVMEGKSKQDIITEWNHAKNKAKHHDHDRKDSELVSFNDCDEAYWMIKRALANARELNIKISNEHEFDGWLITKVCS